MKIEEISRQLKTTDRIEYEGKCHDCGNAVKVYIFRDKETGAITIEGGAVYNPKFGTPLTEHIILKCIKCFKKDKTLRNWNPCEVWSRVVGYLRPVQQYNLGKREEFTQRKEFVIRGEATIF